MRGGAWATRPPGSELPDVHGVDVAPPPVNENERSSGSWSPAKICVVYFDTDDMPALLLPRPIPRHALLAAGRHGIPPPSRDLREIAIAGYPEAVSTDRAAQGKAVSLFLSDTING